MTTLPTFMMPHVRGRAAAVLPLALLLLSSACGQDTPPPKPEEPEPQPAHFCPNRPLEYDDEGPVELTCADAPGLCADAEGVHLGDSPLGTVDVLFVPEGYTETKLPEFRQLVSGLVREMLEGEPTFGAYRDRLRFSRLDLVSATSDYFDLDFTDTALGGCAWERGLGLDPQRLRLAAHVRTPAPKVLVVVTNRATRSTRAAIAPSKSTGGLAYVLMNRDAPWRVLAHELGHSLFFLADEYGAALGEPGVCAPPPPIFSTADVELSPNLASESTGARWSHLVSGAEPGGHTVACGVYNPPGTCMMQEVDQPFCPVCRAHIDGLFSGLAGQDDGPPRCDISLDKRPSALEGYVAVSGRFLDYNGVQRWELRLGDTLLGSGERLFTGFREGVLGRPFAYVDTTRFPNGSYTLRLHCTDTLGNTSLKEVAVRVDN